ncbi:SMP-30/gluconolactonase/LRE family protein [Deinococcus sp. PESE-13]
MTLRAARPEFLDLFPAGAEARRLADGFTWTEGPVYVPARSAVIFSDVRQNRTWAWSDDGQLSPELHPSHHQNGHCLDRQGHLIACSHGLRRLERQREPGGEWEVLADSFEGKKLNSPNDVCLAPDGSLWFSDPTYGIDKPEEGYGGEMELPGRWVFRLAPDGTLSAPIRDRVKPNGLVFLPSGDLLVSDTGDNATHRYGLNARGEAEYQGVHFTVTPGKTDGLRVDAGGLIWASAGDGVHVLTPDGDELGRVLTPQTTSNLCFGGPEGRTLYMTVSTEFWSIETNVRG